MDENPDEPLTPYGVSVHKLRMRTLAVAIGGAIGGAAVLVCIWAAGGMRVEDNPNPTTATLIAAGGGVAMSGVMFGAFVAVLIYAVVLVLCHA